MGVVYKAEDLKLKRCVALKFLPPHLMDSPELKERFLIEAPAERYQSMEDLREDLEAVAEGLRPLRARRPRRKIIRLSVPFPVMGAWRSWPFSSASTSAALASARMVDPEAYEAVLRGYAHWQKLKAADFDQAQRLFETALQKDPSCAPAYSGLAWVWLGRRQTNLVPYSETSKVGTLARQALELPRRAGNR